jgi:hypothetical protein
MKKHLSLTTIFAFILIFGQAQTALKNSVYAGYGRGSFPMIGLLFGTSVITIIPLGNTTEPSSIRSSGVIYLGFQHSMSDKISIEGKYSYEKISLSWKENQTLGIQSYSDHINTITAGIRYTYSAHNKLKFYGRTDIGYLWYYKSNPSDYDISFSKFAFQLTPIGLSYGKNLRGFCELGFGHLGLINGGISCSF